MKNTGQQDKVVLPVRLAIRLRSLLDSDNKVPEWLRVAVNIYLAEIQIVQGRSLEIVVVFDDELPRATVLFTKAMYQSGANEQMRNYKIFQTIAHFSMMDRVRVRKEFLDLLDSERMKYPIHLGKPLLKEVASEQVANTGYSLVMIRPGERTPPPHERRAG